MAKPLKTTDLASAFDAFMATQMAVTRSSVAALAQRDKSLARLIESLDPLQAIATFGGLLARPERLFRNAFGMMF